MNNCHSDMSPANNSDSLGILSLSLRWRVDKTRCGPQIPDSPVPTDTGSPTATSSPVSVWHTRPKIAKKTVLNHPLRILIMNCQLIKNKKPELQTVVDAAKPDIIMGCEFWLSPDIANSNTEIFPGGFDAVRKGQVGDAHEEVLK